MQGIRNTKDSVWDFVDKTNDCWMWKGRKDKDGYGVWWFEGKNVRAHRFIFEIHHGKIEKGKVCRHICNNPGCVNPFHISESTQKENIRDQLIRGTHSKLKYSEDLIKSIREEYSTGKTSTRKISQKYGVSKSHVNYIINRKSRSVAKDDDERTRNNWRIYLQHRPHGGASVRLLPVDCCDCDQKCDSCIPQRAEVHNE